MQVVFPLSANDRAASKERLAWLYDPKTESG